MVKTTDFIEIVTTCPNKSTAEKIGRILVEKRLAACAQLSEKVESIYRWKGEIETNQEFYCVLKTRLSNFDTIAAIIEQNHPYEVPEIIARPIAAINASYKKWLNENC